MKIPMEVYIAVAVLLATIVYLAFVYRQRGKEATLEEARNIAFRLMILAEKKFGSNNGSVKMEWVATVIIPLLPNGFIRSIITHEDLTEFLEDTYRLAKDFVDDGKLNDSILQ